jgi:hypothetical protein
MALALVVFLCAPWLTSVVGATPAGGHKDACCRTGSHCCRKSQGHAGDSKPALEQARPCGTRCGGANAGPSASSSLTLHRTSERIPALSCQALIFKATPQPLEIGLPLTLQQRPPPSHS